MEKVRTNKAGKKFTLVFIIISLLMLVSHLVKQAIESTQSEKDINLNELSGHESSAETIKADSIWHNTEFVQD